MESSIKTIITKSIGNNVEEEKINELASTIVASMTKDEDLFHIEESHKAKERNSNLLKEFDNEREEYFKRVIPLELYKKVSDKNYANYEDYFSHLQGLLKIYKDANINLLKENKILKLDLKKSKGNYEKYIQDIKFRMNEITHEVNVHRNEIEKEKTRFESLEIMNEKKTEFLLSKIKLADYKSKSKEKEVLSRELKTIREYQEKLYELKNEITKIKTAKEKYELDIDNLRKIIQTREAKIEELENLLKNGNSERVPNKIAAHKLIVPSRRYFTLIDHHHDSKSLKKNQQKIKIKNRVDDESTTSISEDTGTSSGSSTGSRPENLSQNDDLTFSSKVPLAKKISVSQRKQEKILENTQKEIEEIFTNRNLQ